ncbi:lipopolysaccharide biosynthesis protein [Rhodococcus ruber]|uniref:lipopolysaccharide biosynthesis protein n=1 Tax=Rhodococcus sp. A5(2022) TaxID=3003588 RepID=UPI0022A8556B|nr:hypothetical protein [Rhodococcus sp. A5(2022)]MCZ1074515.1 hypothetical protein [Rhodococcus sp. A5(2022)]
MDTLAANAPRGALTKVLAKIGGFSLSVALTGFANLLTVPFVIVNAGGAGWASVAVGQSIGALVGVFTLLGWVQSGPTAVARASDAARGRYYMDSVYVRSLTLVATVPAVALASAALGTAHPTATTLSAVALLVVNIGANWFYVGEANPRGLFVFDTVPRTIGIVAATAAIACGFPIEGYSAIVLAGAVVAAIMSLFDVGRRYGSGGFRPFGLRPYWSLVAAQKHGIGTALLSSFYLSMPMLVVQHFAPSAVPQYALIDKIKQQALTAYRPISQALQGWTPRGGAASVLRRTQRASQIAWTLGMLGGIVLVAGAIPLGHVLSGGELVIGWDLAVPVSVAFAANIISVTLGVACLLPLGLEKHVTASAALGVVVMLPLLFPLIKVAGGVGSAWSVAFGQLAVAGYQSVILFRNLRTRTAEHHVSSR